MATQDLDSNGGSRARLDSISHHFLSGSKPPGVSPGDAEPAARATEPHILMEEVRVTSPDAVRALVMASLESYSGISRVLDPELPCPGSPLLALDEEARPLIVSFDPSDGNEALLLGLQAWDELHRNRRWLARLHPELGEDLVTSGLRMMILTRETPAGVGSLSQNFPFITFCTFRILRLNGKTGVIIDELTAPPDRGLQRATAR